MGDYEAPRIKILGKIEDLTQVGFTNTGGDVCRGSVMPNGNGPKGDNCPVK